MNIADARRSPGAADSVTALYTEHALGLVRLAVVLTGDRAAAEDLSIDETAQVMGVSPGTVKSATHRALAAVGRTLKEGS